MPTGDDYLFHVDQLTRQALVQTGALRACDQHPGVLVHQADDGAETMAFNRACIWIKDRVGSFARDDIRDVIKLAIEESVKGECPECTRARMI